MLRNDELLQISGGADLTAAFVTAVVGAITKIYNLGQTMGSALRRIKSKSSCII